MARKNKVMEGIVSLHNRIVDKQKEIRSEKLEIFGKKKYQVLL